MCFTEGLLYLPKECALTAREVTGIFPEIIERAKSLEPVNVRRWFDDLTALQMRGGWLEIGCPEESMAHYLRERCKDSFTRAAQQVTGHLVTVSFVNSGGKDSDVGEVEAGEGLVLHPDYTFENFVVGPSNRLAHASCVAVSQSPADTYNPLFLYGNSGLGKTHLLHGACHATKKHFTNWRIQNLSCEDFVNRFIRAIERGKVAGFQDEFRSVDTLVIDDVQFLREREQSQEEFFHMFNALYNSGKQIVLSADSAPVDIPSLEDRLISRFNWGLVVRIDPPSYDTRVAIVKKKAHVRGLQITDEIAEYVARKVHANIRELEGALTAIYAVATTTGKPITMGLARTALDGQLETTTRQISITDITESVTEYFGVRLKDLQSKKRSQSITEPRQICMYLARNLTKHSLEEIGGHLGGRDHTTVMHACNKIEQLRRDDAKLHGTLNKLSENIVQKTRS